MMAHSLRIAGFITCITIVCISAVAWAAPLSGTVIDAQTLKPVSGATVVLTNTGELTVTDADGRYRFADVAPGPILLRVEAPGYTGFDESLTLSESGKEDAELILLPEGFASEIIEIEDTAPSLPSAPGQQDLRREELSRIPGTRGDALTSLKSLPGVANADAAGNGPGLLVIRGSAPEDSKVVIDGIEIPLLYHFFGLQSIVPSEFIAAIDYLPGGFGVNEGRATGGVISVTTRSDEIKEFAGFAELSFINFAGFVQGPISKEHRLQFTASLRRSAIDLVLPLAIPDDVDLTFTTAPQYYDGQLRVDWRPNFRHRVSMLGLISFDRLTLLNEVLDPNEPALTGRWENATDFGRIIASWNYSADPIENRLIVSGGNDGFLFEIGGDQRYLRFDSRTLEVRDDLSWVLQPQLKLRAGGEMRVSTIDAEVRFPLPPQEGSGGGDNFSSSPLLELMDTLDSHAAAAYVATDLRPIDSMTITSGMRLDYYDRIGRTTWSPRVSIQQALGPDLTTRFVVGAYSRAPQQAEELQTDLMPELATQYVLGADYDVADGIRASMSGFYTDRRQLVVQDAALAATDPMNAYVNRGRGRSFGAETLIRAKRDNFFGWVAYTISRSDRVDQEGAERRLFDYDQTHNLILVGSYTWGPWEFGGRWQYSTGSPSTPIESSVYLADLNIYVPEYGQVNSTRFDPAHQLDLRIDRHWQFQSFRLSAYLDVTNVYANPRTLGYNYNYDFSERQAIEELPLVPAIGLRGSF